jgi:hypothetical protein
MALAETTRWYIGITDDGQLELRRTRVITDGDDLIGERHHRVVLYPGDPSISTYPARVRQIAQIIWTPAVIAAWQARNQEV